ncbi:MAG: class I SAM-dependent methyltransferase [Gemmatimonadetes bacterium]|nr:class I SAM-dependent methyltransferase [Gemmatimonadota bacterium]NNM03700.1 class I SAM-dependent methyltransferase [Gemmatimonadota bacterium]
MSLKDRALEWAPIYRAWQGPFQDPKFEPVVAHNKMDGIRRVLDVGCGPGTNAPYFSQCEYLGVDINPGYIASAKRRYRREFITADVTAFELEAEPFDFILVNSFFHHVSDAETDRILHHLGTLLAEEGHIHILDLVLPEGPSLARLLARLDRGDHPRPLSRWKEIFEHHFEPVVFEPYSLGPAGITFWNMVYFKGALRHP